MATTRPMMSSIRNVFSVFTLLVLAVVIANADPVGSISGAVKDMGGLGIPDVTITIKKDQATVATLMTDAQSSYTAALDSTGDYSVTATKPGYEVVSAPALPVTISGAAPDQTAPDIVMSLLSDLLSPVYRFYNVNTGTHFYTISEGEKNWIVQNLPSYRLEGPVYYAYTTQDVATSPVYRFFNTVTGTHFYTISEGEKNSIVQNLPALRLEGAAYYAYTTQEAGTSPVYRFYNVNTGTHFYTISEGEKNAIIQTLPNYHFEGASYYAYAPCTYSLSASGESFDIAGGLGTVTMTTADRCVWTASTSAGWITITSLTSGTGTDTISFSVTSNSASLARSAAILFGGQAFTVSQAGTSQAAVTSPVYRFFNTVTGTHFYTISEGEKNSIVQNLPALRLEGAAYYAYTTQEAGTSPVYRFYNVNTGTHFYTISEGEKNSIVQNLPALRLEGAAYYAYTTQEAGTSPVYRFYNVNTGTHFYTISEGEKNAIIQTLPNYHFEGPAYYAYTSG